MSGFVFTRGATTWWPVKWNEPADGGAVVEQSMELRFKRTAWDKIDALYQQDNFDFLKAVATDWRDIVDDAGRPVTFDDDAIGEMTNRPAFAEAIGATYIAFLRALPETRLGNSATSPAGGPAEKSEAADGAPAATKASARPSKRRG